LGICVMNAYVYILSNKSRTTFYIGSTMELRRRLMEHRRGKGGGFRYYRLAPSLLEKEIASDIEEIRAML